MVKVGTRLLHPRDRTSLPVLVGSAADASDGEGLRASGVRAVLSVTLSFPPVVLDIAPRWQREGDSSDDGRQDHQVWAHKYVEVMDVDSANLLERFDECFDFIEENTAEENCSVLVHCGAGMSRSPAVCLAYLMRKFRLPLEECLAAVRALRDVEPNFGFMDQLRQYEADLGLGSGSPDRGNEASAGEFDPDGVVRVLVRALGAATQLGGSKSAFASDEKGRGLEAWRSAHAVVEEFIVSGRLPHRTAAAAAVDPGKNLPPGGEAGDIDKRRQACFDAFPHALREVRESDGPENVYLGQNIASRTAPLFDWSGEILCERKCMPFVPCPTDEAPGDATTDSFHTSGRPHMCSGYWYIRLNGGNNAALEACARVLRVVEVAAGRCDPTSCGFFPGADRTTGPHITLGTTYGKCPCDGAGSVAVDLEERERCAPLQPNSAVFHGQQVPAACLEFVQLRHFEWSPPGDVVPWDATVTPSNMYVMDIGGETIASLLTEDYAFKPHLSLAVMGTELKAS